MHIMACTNIPQTLLVSLLSTSQVSVLLLFCFSQPKSVVVPEEYLKVHPDRSDSEDSVLKPVSRNNTYMYLYIENTNAYILVCM